MDRLYRPRQTNTHVICVYKYPGDQLYKTDLVERIACAEYNELINRQFPMPVTELYYLIFDRGDASRAFEYMRECLKPLLYGKNGFYKIRDFKYTFYAILSMYHDKGYDFAIVNNIDDRRDTLRPQFIRRIHARNIYDISEYYSDIRCFSFDFPRFPEMFYKFDWAKIKKVFNQYGHARAVAAVQKLMPQLADKLKDMGRVEQLKIICRADRQIPFDPRLLNVIGAAA
jgi:hypothetical protein